MTISSRTLFLFKCFSSKGVSYLSKLEEIMEELGCDSKEELVSMMNDPDNHNPLIEDLRELFYVLDSFEAGDYKVE